MFNKSEPCTVQEVCEEWTKQQSNPLFDENHYAAMRAIVALIQGMNKKDALKALREFHDNHEPNTAETSLAYLSIINLIHPK